MRHLAPIALLLTGCFYVDPINQRPSIDIVPGSATVPFRGDTVTFDAVASDPENQEVSFSWRTYACTDATNFPAGCDDAPFPTGTSLLPTLTFTVPSVRVQSTVIPVESLLIILEARDQFGATAKPAQQLVVPVDNHPPVVTLRKVDRHPDNVDGLGIDLFASYFDPDDSDKSHTNVVWKVFTPAQTDTFELVPINATQDPDHPEQTQVGMKLTPHGVATNWMVQVTATDLNGATDVDAVTIDVEDDHPPCISQFQPIAPLDGTSALPVDAPTLFQIPVVTDDLDVYPPQAGDAALGVTQFAWSILPQGATTRQALGNTGNSVDFDPSAYTPGDIVELRVEIADRIPRTLTCADSDLTCSVSSDSCIQRLTWRLEVH